MRDARQRDFRVLRRGKVAAEHPLVAVERLAGVDREHLPLADQVDARELRMHRLVVGNLDGADAGADLHAAEYIGCWPGPGDRVAPPVGFEPTTGRVETGCSIP